MNHVEIIGYLATAILGLAFLPQAIQVWQTKSVDDISIVTFSMLMVATAMWVYYGWMKQDWPILTVQILLFFNQGAILLCKVLYGKRRQ